MNTLYVKASAGLQMPKEGNPRSYINDSEPVMVESSHYYQKALIDGDLLEVSEAAWVESQTPTQVSVKATPTPKATAKDAA